MSLVFSVSNSFIKVQRADLTCDVIRKVTPFVLRKLWILVADWSMRWSRDTFLIKLQLYHPAKFAKIWISVEKLKFSQILLGDRNATSLCSKHISTLLLYLFRFPFAYYIPKIRKFTNFSNKKHVFLFFGNSLLKTN